MAKRISSFFASGNGNSDQGVNGSRPMSSIDPDRPKELGPGNLVRRSTQDLRASIPLHPPQSGQTQHLHPAGYPSPIDTARLSPQTNVHPSPSYLSPGAQGNFLQSPLGPQLAPGQRPDSPLTTRPASRGSGGGSRAVSRDGSNPHSRPSSPAVNSRPMTPSAEGKPAKRMSWLPGRGGADSPNPSTCNHAYSAWIIAPQAQDKMLYDLAPLVNFQKVPELWNDSSDTFVYLHARESARGPSFKINSSIFAASRKLAAAAYGRTPAKTSDQTSSGQQSRTVVVPAQANSHHPEGSLSPAPSQHTSSNRSTSSGGRSLLDNLDEGVRRREIHLCIPQGLQANLADPTARLSDNDVENFVNARNLFAFLSGLPLVATTRCPSLFDILFGISGLLERYQFTNLDGSTYGEEVHTAFSNIVEAFNVADVRHSREKTIEGLVLSERFKYWPLYNEAYVHAVGKYEDITSMRSPKFRLIGNVSQKRMERATLDLANRLRNVRVRLDDFDFPSLFAGFASSTTSAESKIVRFKAWKAAFLNMRRYVMSMYKTRYGSWPPKARSKKNAFEESGLNRLLLLELYEDYSSLYDILVDRNSLTTRTSDLAPDTPSESNSDDPTARALRRLLSEYDHNVAPIQPPIPFDMPLIPSLKATRRDFSGLDPHKQKKENMKRLSKDEINQALIQSYNRESMKSTPFLLSFMNYEREQAAGKSIDEIADQRIGQWMFLYVVIQALPLLVTDAPDLKYTKAVEYYLCEAPLSGAPWMSESQVLKQKWYGVAGSAGYVALPSHLVEFGVEGTYHRSHCWTVAEKWLSGQQGTNSNAPPSIPEIDGNNTFNSNQFLPPIATEYQTFQQPSQPFTAGGASGTTSSHSRTPSLPLPTPGPYTLGQTSAPSSRSHSPHAPFPNIDVPGSGGIAGSGASNPLGSGRRRPSSSLNLVNLGLGLEQLPLPQGVGISPLGPPGMGSAGGSGGSADGGSRGNSRPVSQYDPNKSFDAILGLNGAGAGAGTRSAAGGKGGNTGGKKK